jgi:4-hydroxybenzoyl-CoA reductase subunit beta
VLGGIVPDTAPVLCPARVRCRPGESADSPPLYRDDGIAYLAKRPDEIVTDLLLPPADGWRSVYLKLRRRGSFDFPVLGVAVAARLEGDVVRDARIVLGAVASAPRGDGAPRLCGGTPDPELIGRVGLAAGPSATRQHRLPHPIARRDARLCCARCAHRRLPGQR